MRLRPARPARPLRAPWAGPLGLHHPGLSALHRTAPTVKLGGLAVLGIAVAVLHGPLSAVAVTAVAVAAAVTARLPGRSTVRGLVPVLVLAAVVGLYQWWAGSAATGVEVGLDLVALVLAAVVVTATTRSDALLDTLASAARPLRHVGLAPETVALAVGIMLRSIPALAVTLSETRDAARARGLGHEPRALLVPAAVRTVARAQAVGDALAARGLAE